MQATRSIAASAAKHGPLHADAASLQPETSVTHLDRRRLCYRIRDRLPSPSPQPPNPRPETRDPSNIAPMPDVKAKAGLEDIVATDSSICFIDGDRGVLVVSRLRHPRPGAARHLRRGLLPAVARPVAGEGRAWRSAVAARGGAAAARADPAADEDAAAGVDGMDALRTLTSALAHYDRRRARQLAAGVVPQGGAPHRRRWRASWPHGAGCRPAAARWRPIPALGHAANFLYMLIGERPRPDGRARDGRRPRRCTPTTS